MPSLRDEFTEREDDFFDTYEGHECAEVVASLAIAGDILELAFGPQHAALAMTALHELIERAPQSLAPPPEENTSGTGTGWRWSRLDDQSVDADWRDTWSSIDGTQLGFFTPFMEDLLELIAFAKYGIALPWASAGRDTDEEYKAARRREMEALTDWDEGPLLRSDRHQAVRLQACLDMPAWVERACQQIDAFLQMSPKGRGGHTNPEPVHLQLTRDMARARIKYDLRQPLTVHELAALSGVTVKRLQNAIYAKTDEAPVVDRDGLIRTESCELWLSTRDYTPSIWQQVAQLFPLTTSWGRDVPYEDAEPDRQFNDFVFVPVARDGSMFTPSLRTSGHAGEDGYTIGAKGSERVVADYHTALAELHTMETPRWRRPNPESGKRGIVAGQTWKRIRRSELEGL